MIEKKIELILGEAAPISRSHRFGKVSSQEFTKPPDTGFRRGHSQEHKFGLFGVDAVSDISARDVQFNVQQNLRCCWTCEYITGKRLTGLSCKNPKNFTRAFESVEAIGFCSRYKNGGIYK